MGGQAVDGLFADSRGTMRERELELEIARLNAEIDTLRGEGLPTDVGARFLAMAASTVDQAMREARREIDEFAAEASAEAEARREEATRSAEEADRRATALRAEAEQSETIVRQAEAEADDIRAIAEQEAADLVVAERSRAASELEALSGVRTALEDERESLDSYHAVLQRRVQDLAESMVAFMTTEPPLRAAGAVENPAAAALEAMSEREMCPVEPVADRVTMTEEVSPAVGGLFGRATEEEQRSSTGLFEQTAPEELADAVADEDHADERFRSFIAGDDGNDPSRDWLLRSEQH